MTKFLTYRVFPIGIFALLFGAEGFSFNNDAKFLSRRDSFTSMLNSAILSFPFLILSSPTPTMAAADCSNDCTKNCKIIAPKDDKYCTDTCEDYCSQEGRTDGLSGSVSAQNGEVGILGGSFGQGTVLKGEDRPPSIKVPGLDFSSDNGKKLIGY